MKKEQIDEMRLLADAKRWFEEKQGVPPQKCGINFVKVWYKPTPFKKTICVVLAPSGEVGTAFIKEQNTILRTIKNLWLLVFFPLGFIFSICWGVVVWFLSLSICLLFWCIYMYYKCQKWEKIHQWKVDVYYP